MAGTWQTLTQAPSFSASTMLLLTDGTVMCYAVMPFPGCSGCLGPLAPLNALTSTSSHELCEAITDAHPWTGWNDDTNGEMGDICAWQTDTIGSFTVQKEWSNFQGACVIKPSTGAGQSEVDLLRAARGDSRSLSPEATYQGCAVPK